MLWLLSMATIVIGAILVSAPDPLEGIYDYVDVTGAASISSSGSCSAVVQSEPRNTEILCAYRCASLGAWCQFFSPRNQSCVLANGIQCATGNLSWAIIYQRRPNASSGAATEYGYGYEEVIDGVRYWVFQQRRTGTVNFVQNWTAYENGFGDADEFWSGLRQLSNRTLRNVTSLRIEFTTVNFTFYVGFWSKFSVGNASTNYLMTYQAYQSGNISGDGMVGHSGMMFTTIDRDNDMVAENCASTWGGGGFWYNNCLNFNPNGKWSATTQSSGGYISSVYVESGKTLRALRMMIKVI